MDRQVNALDYSTSTVFKKVKDISRPVYRYPYFDALKAIAIFMVVLQHCYIYLGNGMYEDSIVNQTVSMISVPTFMLVSGYFYFTGSKNLEKFFKREGQLILPFFLWSFFYFLAFHDIFYRDIGLGDFSLGLVVDPYFCSPIWFLRTLALIISLAWICSRLRGHSDVLCMTGTFILFNILSFYVTKQFAIQSIAANMGYFIIGYSLCKYQGINSHRFKQFGFICAVVFPACILLKVNDIQLGGTIFKACNYSGVITLAFILSLVKDRKIISWRPLQYLGKHTLEVYVTHFAIVYLLMLFNVPVIVELPFICMIGYSILTIVISLIIYGFIARTPFKSLIYGKFSKNAPCAFRQYLNNA